jgi:Sec-independent protein translocase protein TatA
MGFGTEILFIVMLGLLVLGPKQLYAMLGHVSRAKAELENAARGIKAQLAAELDGAPRDGKTDGSPELAGKQ